ncbi:MAG: hypothetical protein WC989_08990 [Micavibrio sp.]
MLESIDILTPSNDNATRIFILNGLNTIEEKHSFILQPARGENEVTARIRLAGEALEARIPLAAKLIKTPYFSKVVCLSVDGTDCIALTAKGGVSWDQQTGHRATLENTIQKVLETGLESSGRLAGKTVHANGYDHSAFEDEIREFIEMHELQKRVSADGGTLTYKQFSPDKGELVLVFGGACASAATCAGSQIMSRNWIAEGALMRFPGQVRKVSFETAPD